MAPKYSNQLLQLASSHPLELKAIERFLVSLIINRYLSKDSPQSLIMNLDNIMILNRNLIHELITHYNLQYHDTPDSPEDTILIIIPPETLPQIPKCSCTKYAMMISKKMKNNNTNDDNKTNNYEGRSKKYSHSMLKIQRQPLPLSSPSNRSESETSATTSEEMTCSVLLPETNQYENSNSIFAPFYDHDDDDDDDDDSKNNNKSLNKKNNGNEYILSSSLEEVCCVCLDPLLQVSRAKNGETLSILKCNHIMHTPCAQEVKIYSNTSSSSSMGRSLNNMEPLRCPICRSKSYHTLEAPLTLNNNKNVTTASSTLKTRTKNPIIPSSSSSYVKGKGKKGRRKNQEDSEEDVLYLELMGMGFEETDVRRAIDIASGDKEKAVNHLLTYS